MAFIDVTDFTEIPYKIPNQEESREFVTFIETIEEKILKSILGYDLYTEFVEAIEDSGTPDEKWTNLLNGATYVNNEVTYEYKGLVDLLKPAIYSEWVRATYRRLTSAAMIVNNGQQNTTAVNPTDEIVSYWNEYVTRTGGSFGQINTFYGFMIANESDYEDWVFTPPCLKNSLNF